MGWGFRDHEIGPELMFGTIMGERYDQPVLLIKTADEFVSQGGHWYCHYNGSAANYALIGYALAMALDP